MHSSERSPASGVLKWARHTLLISFWSASCCQEVIFYSRSSFSWKISPIDPCFNGHELRVGRALGSLFARTLRSEYTYSLSLDQGSSSSSNGSPPLMENRGFCGVAQSAFSKQNGSSFRARGESRTSTDLLNDIESQDKGSAKDSTVEDNQLNYGASIPISKYRIHRTQAVQNL